MKSTSNREIPLFNDGEFTLPASFDYNRFTHAIIGQDDIGSIVRCHFEAERTVIGVLEYLTSGRYAKTKDRYLSQRIELCYMLGVCDEYLQPFRTLNSHRNDFAHEGKDEIEKKFSDRLFNDVKRMYPPFHNEFRMTIIKAGFDKKLSDCTPKETVGICCLMMTSLFAMIPRLDKKYWSV